MDGGLRRDPRPGGPTLHSDPDVVALIRDEIARTGPITFARFMDLALYAPALGYYTSPPTRIGRRGDFLTAPETHPIFGAALARQVADAWHRLGRPPEFTVREYGAGRGALAEAIIRTLAADEPELARALRYEAVEINPHRRDELVRRLADALPGAAFSALGPATAAGSAPAPAGLVLANEFLDAFPVHRVEQTAGGLRELYVDWRDEALVDVPGPASTPLLAERLEAEGIRLEAGQRAEIALGLDGWLAEVARWLRRGFVIVIDYGYPADDLYARRRRAGTLMGYVDHHPVDDPLVAVGRQDLTTHVDFTAVERAATAAGLTTIGSTTQASFLVSLGLEDLLERARSSPDLRLEEYLELRSGIVRLLDPRHTGGFRVLVLGHDADAGQPLLGLHRVSR